tara:strand:+ start:6392 stop:7237 length:846 start_codon:yes stop_codon:yes gene_type:complete
MNNRQNMIYKGVFHVHTTYSCDATLTLEDYVAYAKQENISFIFFAEHDGTFTKELYDEYKTECKRLSTDSLLLVPGIEFTIEGKTHIAVFGLEEFHEVDSVEEKLSVIKNAEGLSSYAHPAYYHDDKYSAEFVKVDAIEILNSRYNNTCFPNYKSYSLYQRYRRENKNIAITCGPDWHHEKDFKGYVYHYLKLEKLDKDEILDKIRNKQSVFGKGIIKYNPDKISLFIIIYMYLTELIVPIREKNKSLKYYFMRAYEEIVIRRNILYFNYLFQKYVIGKRK